MIALDAIRECLEGAVPATVATCDAEGMPNVSYVSEVHYVDSEHVALSFQFFNKTHQNVLANPHAEIAVLDPTTGARYNLEADYVRTETAGPLFETMKAKLAGIASHTGMSGVFRLRGSDVYRVLSVTRVPGPEVPQPAPRRNQLSALRACVERVTTATDLASLFDEVLAALEAQFDIRHSMLLLLDASGCKLYTVASRGYQTSGVGSEIALGCGVIGVAAAQRVPIRITHMTIDYSYGRAIRESVEQAGLGASLETAIPFPGLPDSRSQLAAPILLRGDLLGVLYAESQQDRRFGYDEEDMLVTLASQLGSAMHVLEQAAENAEEASSDVAQKASTGGAPLTVRHYAADGSIFLGDDYLIKGVAGAIFRKLLRDFEAAGRTEFTNRELRLDPSLKLPDLSDNLEARLILLQRRLAERCKYLRIEKTGRGRFRLVVERPVRLADVPG